MKQAIVIILVLVFGFLMGIAYSLVAMPQADDHTSAASRLDIAMFKRLDELDASNQAERRESVVRFQALARSIEGLRGQVAQIPAESRSEQSNRKFVKSGGTTAAAEPSERTSRLLQLKHWKDDGSLREKWLSASADEVKSWFGIPDQVTLGSDANTMTYWQKDGERVAQSYQFQLKGGRVADMVVDRK